MKPTGIHVILMIYARCGFAQTSGKNGGGMSVNRVMQWTSIYSQPKRQWLLLAVGLALTPWFAAVSWAENFDLESVDFTANGEQTSIILHTGSIVPVRKVMTTDSKLILEIDQVNTQETVRTNFSGASNISHVIMQPINEHKIRMIIRGENLAPPSVAFFNQNTGSSVDNRASFDGEQLRRQTQTALRQLQESGMQPANYSPEPESKPLKEVKPAAPEKAEAKPAKPEGKNIDGLAEEESIPFGGLTEDVLSTSPETLATSTTAKLASEDGPEEVKPLSISSLEMPSMSSELVEKAKSGQYNNYILGGLLALMALGVGGFVIHKVIKLKQVEPDLEDLLLEQTSGKKVSFKEMAQAYRNKHDQGKKPEFASKPSGKKHAEDVIGLRSLNQWDDEVPVAPVQQPKPAVSKPRPSQPTPAEPFGGKTPTMEQLIAMVQAASEQNRTPAKPSAPKKQAVNQYAQAEKTKAQPQKKTGFPDETMVKEMKRAQALQQELLQQAQQQIASAQANKLQPKTAPVNRAAAAQKAVKPANFKSAPASNPVAAKRAANPMQNAASATKNAPGGKNGPLPGNPEVLNFLRNVADLMEKDGKPQIANSIHKNLNPGR